MHGYTGSASSPASRTRYTRMLGWIVWEEALWRADVKMATQGIWQSRGGVRDAASLAQFQLRGLRLVFAFCVRCERSRLVNAFAKQEQSTD